MDLSEAFDPPSSERLKLNLMFTDQEEVHFSYFCPILKTVKSQ